MAYHDVASVTCAIIFQRFIYISTKFILSSRPASTHKNYFFGPVFNLSYMLIAAALGGHIFFSFLNLRLIETGLCVFVLALFV